MRRTETAFVIPAGNRDHNVVSWYPEAVLSELGFVGGKTVL